MLKILYSVRYTVMLRCWDANPKTRPTFDELGDELREMRAKFTVIDLYSPHDGVCCKPDFVYIGKKRWGGGGGGIIIKTKDNAVNLKRSTLLLFSLAAVG